METATPGSPTWSCPPTPPNLPTSRTPSPSRPSSRSSPEPNCAICLGKVTNASVTDMCSHRFCFKCLVEWSKIKAECPLCKTAFKHILHTIESDYKYEQYKVPSPPPTRDLSGDGFFRVGVGAGSWFLNDIIQFREQFNRSIVSSLSLPSLMPVPDHRFRSRLESRRPRRRGLATSEFRADIYQRRLRVEPDSVVDAITGRARECSPAWYRDNPAQTHRLVPWLNRELNALLATQPQRTMYVSQMIMEEILRSDIRSQELRDRLLPYLGTRTEHFQHEFFNFARSVYDMIGYDQHAVYVEHREQSASPDEDDIIFVEEVLRPRQDSPEERVGGSRLRDALRPDRPHRPARARASPPPSFEGPSTSAAISPEEVINLDLDSPEVIHISDNDESPGLNSSAASQPPPAQARVKRSPSESEPDDTILVCEKPRRKSEKRHKSRRRSPSSSGSSSGGSESDYERERKQKKFKGKGKGKNSGKAVALKQRKKSKKRRRKRERGSDSDSEQPSSKKHHPRAKSKDRGASDDEERSPSGGRWQSQCPARHSGRRVRLLEEPFDHSFGQNSLSSAGRKRLRQYNVKDPSDLRLTLLSRKKAHSSEINALPYANDYCSDSSSEDEGKSGKIQSKIVKVQTFHG